jgi:hypothetical protein
MDYNNYLENFQNQLKKELIGNMDEGLALLDGLIANHADKKNELFNIIAQSNDLEDSMQKGVLSYENSVLQKNRIRAAVMSYIDDIQYDDLDKDSDYVKNNDEFINYYQAYIATTHPPEKIVKTIKKTVVSSDFKMGLDGLIAVSEDYLFIRFYPKVYREMRAYVFKRSADDKLLTLVYLNLERMENIFLQHDIIVNKLSSLEKENMERGTKIRRELRSFENIRTRMEQDTFDDLGKLETLIMKMESMIDEK